MLNERRVHVCVSGGIAAYKAALLVRALVAAGAQVRVAMTENAQRFIGPLTFQALTSAPVLTRTLDPSEAHDIGHIAFAQDCDVLIVAPATANIIGKAANGIGDDAVSTVLLAANVPVVVAPAMNSFMWANPAVQRNVEALSARGWHVVPPDEGVLACGHTGPGRLPDAEVLVAAVVKALTLQTLVGHRLVVSAGPTREFVDPVRFLSNPSSGRTGFAIAAAAAQAGAEVTLVHGPVALACPPGVRAVPVVSARDMHTAVLVAAQTADAVVMSAAVADWRPTFEAKTKQHKSGETAIWEMAQNPDILADLGARRAKDGAGPVLVGFAAETGDPVPSAQDKLRRKQVDLVVANDVSAAGCGFEGTENTVWFVSEANVEALPMQAKTAIAEHLVRWIAERLA